MRTGVLALLVLVGAVLAVALSARVASAVHGDRDELRLESPRTLLRALDHHDRRMHGHESPERFLEKIPGAHPDYYPQNHARSDVESDLTGEDDAEVDEEKRNEGDDPNDGTENADHASNPSRGLRDAYKTYRFRGMEENMRARYYRFQELSAKAERGELTVDEAQEMEELRRRGFFKSIGKGIKKVAKFVGKGIKAVAKGAVGVVTAVAAGAGKIANGSKKNLDEMLAQDIEDCVGCRFVWLGVELEVGNSQVEETIYDSFVKRCMEAEKAPIFFQTCQDMFDDVYGMIGDYMNGFTVNQVCEGAKMCR